MRVIETEMIPLPDGTRLAARIWMPEGQGPLPAVLEYIPYRRRDRTRMRDESMHPVIAAAGYVSLRVDMRGTGDSDGLMADEYSAQEIADGVEVIAWIAAQPWCDGKVGMFGKSWGAFSALQVAARRPPALKAIAPVMGTDDRWREDIHFFGGALGTDNFWWGSIMQLLNALPPDPAVVGAENWRAMWKQRLEAMTYWPAQWLAHQTEDETWRRGSVASDYADVAVPVYFFGGWADLYRDTPFRLAEHLAGPVKTLIGPWAHLYPHEGCPGPQVDFLGELIRWWDHWLKGRDTGLMDEPPLRFFIQEAVAPTGTAAPGDRPGRWVEEAGWPSPSVSEEVLWLNADRLGAAPEAEGGVMTVSSPADHGQAGGDMCSFAIAGDLPLDQRIEAGGALVFRGAALAEAVDILGRPRVEICLVADRPQGFVAVSLIDEAPDGVQLLVARGFLNLCHRSGSDAPLPVVPGEEMAVTVPLHGIGQRVAAGHRLVIHVASNYWPILWPAPEPVTLTLRAGASRLCLPVRRAGAEGVLRDLALPPPAVPARMSTLREGRLVREICRDLVSGMLVNRVFIDGGVFGPVGEIRLDETGTEMGDVSERVYAIGDDPLSARAEMTQRAFFRREGWNPVIETHAEMTATASHFRLRASVTCRDGDAPFHHVEWDHEIPRNGM